ncbi:alpha/beta fold hydrolase [Rhodococcus sp. MSC1_016]|uniref:alpha/beta fold hydrolase n=1 Tax=Rhodococcus sp. MSC1_016 TaxID=2909266 RepID=UPI00202EE2A8|nr:alpha/beta hydrolase [Rhodococcus sp. MSC1_016]
MAHATGLHGAVWGPLARRLDGWHCRALDLRGHGDSPVPGDDDLHWSGFGRDVRSVVESVGGPVVGVGHSLGGVAMLMAALDAPELFSALVLYEPALRMETGALDPALAQMQAWMVKGAASRRARFSSRAEALCNYAVKQPFADIQAETLHAYVQHGFRDTADGAVELKCLPSVEAQIFARTHEHDAVRSLHDLSCPVVIVRGEDTDPQQVRSAEGLAAVLARPARILPGADHFGPLVQPTAFAAIVRDAVGELGLATPS